MKIKLDQHCGMCRFLFQYEDGDYYCSLFEKMLSENEGHEPIRLEECTKNLIVRVE